MLFSLKTVKVLIYLISFPLPPPNPLDPLDGVSYFKDDVQIQTHYQLMVSSINK